MTRITATVRSPCPICGTGTKGCSSPRETDGVYFCRGAHDLRPGQVRDGFAYLGEDKVGFGMWKRDNGLHDDRRRVGGGTNGHKVNGVHVDAAAKAAEFAGAYGDVQRRALADHLGLPSWVVDGIEGVGWSPIPIHKDMVGGCWTIPQHDGRGKIVGINCRYTDGVKRNLYGTRQALFVPLDWRKMAGPVLLPEGASDTLALAGMGLAAVGRPSDKAGVDLLADLLRDLPDDREVIVLGENDANKAGQAGALKVATELTGRLGRPVKAMLPPAGVKDARAWAIAQQLPEDDDHSWRQAGERFLASLVEHKEPSQAEAKQTPRVTVPPWRPFPLAALPPVVSEYVMTAAHAIGCDPALVALPMLATLAGAIGNARALVVKRGWSEPAILWTLTVAGSGDYKTPAYSAATGPLVELQFEKFDDHRAKVEQFNLDLQAWAAADKDSRGDKPQPPGEPPTFVTNDTTVEALGNILRDAAKGLLVARDELDGWFGSFTRYKGKGGGTDRPQWLEFNRAGPYLSNRVDPEKKGRNTRRCCVSVTGTIQPVIVAKALDPEAMQAGLGARFMMAMPPRRKRVWSEQEIPEDLEARYARLLESLLALPLADPKKRKPHFLGMSPEAKALWVQFFNEWGGAQFNAEGEEAAALSKLEGYAVRLALVHHVTAHVAAGSSDLRPVGEVSIRAGIDLAKWFAYEAKRIYATLRESQEDRDVRRLVEYIRARGGSITPRDLQRNNGQKYPTVEHAEAALDALVPDHGAWAIPPANQGGGRPKGKTLSLNPTPDKTDKTPSGEDADHDEAE